MNKYKYRCPRRVMPGVALPDQGTQSVDINTFKLQREREFFGGLRFFLSDVPNETTGMVGIHLDQTDSEDGTPFGLSFDIAETPVFELYVSNGTVNVKTSDPAVFTVGSLNVSGAATLASLTVTGATSLAGATISGTSALTDLTVSGTSLLTGLLTAGAAAFSGAIGGSGTAFSFKRFALTFPSDADYTLAAGEKDAVLIDVQAGVITAPRNIVVPGTGSGFYYVINRNAFAVTLKTAGGTGIAVAATRARVIAFPSGVNAFALTVDTDYTV